MSTIVVGVDGSEGARHALEYALDEAELRGANVRVVTAWHAPTMVYAGGYVVPVPSEEEWERGARKVLDQTVEAVNGAKEHVDITPVVREGQPADVLCEESKDAELLVVGSRGLGGFHELLVGSVSHQCAQHAHCPVTIVPKS
jgi:nucleotide-binding universal stress UspA family protein